MGCKASKNDPPAEPVAKTASVPVSVVEAPADHTNELPDIKPVDTVSAKEKSFRVDVPKRINDGLETLHAGDSRSKASGSRGDDQPPVKSNTLIEQERRRLSVSTISREDTEPIKPPIAATNFCDPALELVEKDRGVIREVTVQMIDHILAESTERVMIFGARALDAQKGFDNKNMETVRASGVHDVGYMCKKGHKPESPNQDDFFVMKVNDWSFYGVFDGHGPCGHDVSHFVHNTLPFLLVGDKNFEVDPLATMKRAFRKVHHLLEAAAEQPNSHLDCTLSGTTGTIVVHKDRTLYVAHVGDSRAVLARRNSEGKIVAMNLTSDHKPTRSDERRRIENAGGDVRRLEGDIPHRVFVKNRMYPGLAMSRAIGDTIGSSVGVIPDPDARIFELTDNDVFFTLCTDGVWEFVSSQQAIDLICKHPRDKVADASEALASESWNRWIEEEDNVVDDITGIIVYL